MPRISREEGYRRGAGKEQAAIAMAAELLEAYGVATDPITSPSENHLHGDLRARGLGWTLEVKGQPTDHRRYAHNFIEVMEDTSALRKAHHVNGFDRTAEILGLRPEELERIKVNVGSRNDPSARPLGRLPFASASLESFSRARFVAYVNTDGLIYLYGAHRLLRHIEGKLRRGARLVRGAGNSNEDTLAIFTGHGEARWQRRGHRWIYDGAPYLDERVVRACLHRPASWPKR